MLPRRRHGRSPRQVLLVPSPRAVAHGAESPLRALGLGDAPFRGADQGREAQQAARASPAAGGDHLVGLRTCRAAAGGDDVSDYVPTQHERESAEAREALWNALGRRPDGLFVIASALTAAEERGRRRGIEEAAKKLAVLNDSYVEKSQESYVRQGRSETTLKLGAMANALSEATEAVAALAPRDSGRRRHRCMRCGDEFDCTAEGCVAKYDVLPTMIRGGVVVEHECKQRED